MANFFVFAVTAALLLVVFSSAQRAGLKLLAHIFALVGLLLFTLLCAALLFGVFYLERQGAGVLLLLAIPAGIVAALFWVAFRATSGADHEQGSVAQFKQTESDINSEILRLEQRIAQMQKKSERFWLSAKEREKLRLSLVNQQQQLHGLKHISSVLNQRQTRE